MKKYLYDLMTDSRQGWLAKVLQGLLWVLSLAYGVIVTVTRFMYQGRILPRYQASKSVICVGNITTGGVGKTPLVIWITKILENKGRKVVVLSRGYKSCDGTNDEIEMFKEVLPHVPVMIGRDRRISIQKAVDQGQVDMFVADDAFQHWPLKRDLDIVAIDAVNPFGNGYMLPRGILREKPLALNRADVFVLTKTDKVQSTKELRSQLNRINNKALIVESCHVPLHFR